MGNRKVMQQALECIERCNAHGWILADYEDEVYASIDALKAALEQQEPSVWRDMVVVSLVREGIDKHKARELADHFAAQPEQEPVPEKEWIYGTPLLDAMTQDFVPSQRPWVGLNDDDWPAIDNKKDTALDSFAQGAVWAADQLKERNTCLG